MKILVVEDQARVGVFIEKALEQESYTVFLANSCATAREALAESPYDAVILDLGLPDGDGFALLSEWRASGFAEPVLILSARDAVQDRIRGLNLGADDYLSKPFSIEELIARLRSIFRRQSGSKVTVLTHGPVRLDLLAHVATLNGVPIDLTSRELSFLELFLQNQNRVLTRTMIAEKIWQASYDMETNLIDVYIRRLRLKLEDSSRPLIKTIRGVGYKLI